jgi:hypothetical protein
VEKIDGNARYCAVTRYVTALRYSLRYSVTDRPSQESTPEIGYEPIVPAAKKEAAIALELEQKMPNPFKWAKEKSWKL